MADRRLLKIVRKGVDQWNDWRAEHRDDELDMNSADLGGLQFIGADLRKANLYGTDLMFAELIGANLSGANLGWANLTESNLSGADLSEAILRNATLSDANLCGACLSDSDLSGADLKDANLHDADLKIANLSGTNLNGAILRYTDLSDANLSRADLSGADLSGADLSGANLGWARLDGANLNGADLNGVILVETSFANLDMTGTMGLDSCVHPGPSTLDFRTLLQSGPLPLSFLRGCGLPEAVIKLLPSIRNESIEFNSCFISYSTRDQDFANRIHADLQNKGVRCWFAPHDIKSGKKIHEQIDEAIRVYDRLLLILSEASMASEWVKTEIANARQKELSQQRQVLFPISLVQYDCIRHWKSFDSDTGKDSAREIREYFIPDFSGWKDHDQYQRAFDKLLKGLKNEM